MEIFTANISTGETYRLHIVHLSMILDDGASMVQRLFSIQIETERWIYGKISVNESGYPIGPVRKFSVAMQESIVDVGLDGQYIVYEKV